MKKGAYDNSRTKHKLLEKRRDGVKEVIWKLNPEQRAFIEDSLNMPTEAYLFEVKTRTFYRLKELDHILKIIHSASKEGKRTIVLKLDKSQLSILNDYGISYRPYKYKIKVCG